jgi:hypothetical protein
MSGHSTYTLTQPCLLSILRPIFALKNFQRRCELSTIVKMNTVSFLRDNPDQRDAYTDCYRLNPSGSYFCASGLRSSDFLNFEADYILNNSGWAGALFASVRNCPLFIMPLFPLQNSH